MGSRGILANFVFCRNFPMRVLVLFATTALTLTSATMFAAEHEDAAKSEDGNAETAK